jgi:hypothetical protein
MTNLTMQAGRDSLVSSRVALRVFLGAVLVAAVLGLLVILDVMQDTRLVATGALVAGACLATLLAALVAGHGRFVRAMHLAMLSAVLGTLCWVALVWLDGSIAGGNLERGARVAGAFTVLAAWLIFAGMTLGPRAHGGPVVAVRTATIVLATFWAAFGELALAFPDPVERLVEATVGAQWFARIVGASVVVVASGALAQPVLLRLARARHADGEGALRGRHARVALTCPRCGASAELEANRGGECPSCRLAVRVEVEEPRCACGYLLFGLDAPACPECGAAIADTARWHGRA